MGLQCEIVLGVVISVKLPKICCTKFGKLNFFFNCDFVNTR